MDASADFIVKLFTSFGLSFWKEEDPVPHADRGFREHLYPGDPAPYEDLLQLMHAVPEGSVLRFEDPFRLRYAVMHSSSGCFALGPYLPSPISDEALLALMESLGLEPARFQEIQGYYRQITILEENAAKPVLLLLADRVFGGEEYEILSKKQTGGIAYEIKRDAAPSMEVVRERYDREEDYLAAIRTGDTKKAMVVFQAFEASSNKTLSPRLSNPLRDRKDLLITLNTITRKAAQQCGVHPFYIDRLSNRIVADIERTDSPARTQRMSREIVSRYCSLIREYSLLSYSPVVRKAVDYVNQNLKAELSLRVLADYCHVNESYLSARFRKETGFTPTQYISRQRVRLAGYLLVTTPLSVRVVAREAGFSDYNYFSRIFRKMTGIAPSGYRKKGKKPSGME
jgi:AraC-like DNA-binding protein